MLFLLTSAVDLLGLCIGLWLALYLLGRGFPSSITLRAVVVLLALATFFLSASINLHLGVPGATTIRAVLLVVALSTWLDLTHRLLPARAQRRNRWLVGGFYALGLATIGLLLGTRNVFVADTTNTLWVGRMSLGPVYVIYGVVQAAASLAILNNFRLGARVGVGRQNRYFLAASILAVSTVGYGVLALALTPPLPRLIQDALILSGMALLGFSVARYQTLVERRTTLQDFPVSALAVFSISAVYALIAWRWGATAVAFVLITGLAILTHASYDLTREFLDRLRYKDENEFRRQLRRLENDQQRNGSLPEGLILLCRLLNAEGGFIAVRQGETYAVSASHHSIPLHDKVPGSAVTLDDMAQPDGALANEIAWLAPARKGGEQVAVIGIGSPRIRHHYSGDDLDLLAEAADRVGSIVHLQNTRLGNSGRLIEMISDEQARQQQFRAESDGFIETLATSPDPEFVKQVEDGLRNLADILTLGQSPLAKRLAASGVNQIERGKVVQQQLIEAIEVLRPDKPRPPEPLPREWHNYAVLHDAYVEEVPNREIMARLYISEGTFNRSRRKALRGVARYLLEK